VIGGVRRAVWGMGLPVRVVLVGLIRLYRVTLAGLLGGQCRFHPSCSHYAELAIQQRGAIQGAALAGWRVLRCSPLTPGGVDHPPGAPAWRVRPYDGAIHMSATTGAAG
jgi:uncharacterized protein